MIPMIEKLDHHRKQVARGATRAFKVAVGLLLVVAGLLSVPTPLPIGFVLTLIGLAILAAETPLIGKLTRRTRSKVPMLDRSMTASKDHLPKGVKRFVEETEV